MIRENTMQIKEQRDGHGRKKENDKGKRDERKTNEKMNEDMKEKR